MPDDHCDCNTDYNELLKKLSAAELENKKLAREFRALEKRFEISKLNVSTQTNVNKGILFEKRVKETYLRLLLETCPDMIFMFNKDFEFQLGSRSIEAHLDISDISLLNGRSISSIVERYQPPVLTEDVVNLINNYILRKGSGKLDEYIDIEASGHIYRGNIVPFFKDDNEFLGVFLVITDVTDVVKKEMAEQASRTKSNFLARMSHEIRTPLGAIMGMAELALREDIPEAATEYISTILQAGENLLDIINDILDLSKIETGQFEIANNEYMINSLINDVINIIKPRTLDSRLRFIVDVDNKMPSAYKGDVVRIRQIIINLLSNAVKYTDKGFVHFSIMSERIDEKNVNLIIKVEDSGRGIKEDDLSSLFQEYSRFDLNANKYLEGTGLGLAITHTLISAMGGEIYVSSKVGEGSVFTAIIPQEVTNHKELAHVRNPEALEILIYERREILVDPITQTMDSLGVRYKLVSTEDEFHEEFISDRYSFVFLASILYDSAKSKYKDMETDATVVLLAEFGDVIPARNVRVLTTPVFSVPFANLFNGDTDNFTRSPGDKASAGFIAPDAKILIVDDINTNLIIAKGLIQPYEIQIDMCTSGQEAINAVSLNKYDMIFMDYMMPEMDGVEATKKIREMGESYYTNLPIIALTANFIMSAQDMFKASGFNDFLSKPIEIQKLNVILKKWIPAHKQITSGYEIEVINEADEITINTATVFEKIKGLNVKKGIQLSGGTIEYFYETIASFCLDIPERFELIKACIKTKNLQGYTTYVHAIRSASANIGADRISKLAFELEEAGNGGDWDYILNNNDIFISGLEKLVENIKSALSAYDKKADDGKDTDREEKIKKELNFLKSALNVFDIDTVNKTVDTLLRMARTEDEKKKIRKISEHILRFEYEEAYRMIN